MISFPPCKINLGLSVLRKRSDGYHDIETCFYPVPFTDIVEVVRSAEFGLTLSGEQVPGHDTDNLCVRAYELINRDFSIGPVRIHLHKVIPAGAGLGGGSSDAAHTLILLDRVFSLGLEPDRLFNYASLLGSDCPFFLEDTPKIGEEKGYRLKPIRLSLDGRFLVILKPPIQVETATAYRGITPNMPETSCGKVVSGMPIEQWRNNLKNDFEKTIFVLYPQIAHIKTTLYESGASYASMTGSGSGVYAIFDSGVDLPDSLRPYLVWSGYLSL